MKGKVIAILIIINLILVGIIYNFINKENVNNRKQIIKEMTENEQVTNLQTQINNLQDSHTEYANHIEESKKKIASAITEMGVDTSSQETFELMADNIKNIKGTSISSASFFDLNKLIHNMGEVDQNNIITLPGKSASLSVGYEETKTNPFSYESDKIKIYDDGKILAKIEFTVTATTYAGRTTSNQDQASSTITYSAQLVGNNSVLNTNTYSLSSDNSSNWQNKNSTNNITVIPFNYNLDYNNEIVIKANGSCWAKRWEEETGSQGASSSVSISNIKLYYVKV